MKKLSALIVLLFLAIAIVGCQTTTFTTTETTTTSTTTTTKSPLAIPANAQVVENILTFDSVANAYKYRLSVTNQSTFVTTEYFVTSGFNLFLILEAGYYSFQIKTVGSGSYADSDYSAAWLADIVDPDRTSLLEADALNDFQYIRWLGRTYYDVTNARKYFYFTASGFEISFYGTELEVDFYATNSLVVGKRAYLNVLVDNDEDPTHAATFILDEPSKTIKVVEGLEEGFHTVKVLKRSEAQDSDTAVTRIETDGYLTDAPLAKNYKIQVIAASSSTGYGNLAASAAEARNTANSNGLLGFAYLAAYMLDADISIVASSGWGVTRGWNTNGQISATQVLPNAYNYIGIDAQNVVFTQGGLWDHSDYVPDLIIVNMGTNDFNAPSNPSYDAMTLAQKQTLIDYFVLKYVEFIYSLHNNYPEATIIVGYGLMNDASKLQVPSQTIVATTNAEIGCVYLFQLEAAGTNGNAFGSGYHPNVGTHMNVADDLVEFITSITGRQKVRDNIVY